MFSCKNKTEKLDEQNRTISQISLELLDFPNDTSLLIERRDMYLEDSLWSEAITDQLQLFLIDTSNVKYRFDLADLYYNHATINVDYFSLSYDLVRGNYEYAPILLLRAKLNYLIQNYKSSLSDINEYLPIKPFDSEAYYYKGMNFKEMGDLTLAKSQFQTAVEQNPNFIDAYEQLAFIYSYNNDTLAEYYYINAIELDSTQLHSWYNLGMYYQKLGKFKKAKEAYTFIIQNDSANTNTHYNLAYVNLELQDYYATLQHIEIVLQYNSDFAPAYFSRGLAYKYLGDKNRAQSDFEQTLILDRSFIEAELELNGL